MKKLFELEHEEGIYRLDHLNFLHESQEINNEEYTYLLSHIRFDD